MDSTSIRFRYSKQVARGAITILKDGFVDTLLTNEPDALPPGKKAAPYTWTKTLDEMLAPEGLGSLPYMDVLAIVPHMHTRGVTQRFSVGDPGEEKDCKAFVERWDFHWQKIYFYRDPVRLTADTELEFSCTFDTLSATEPVLPGWSYLDEMCAAILMLGLPPGM
jgi:hypothetical protein